MKKIVFYVAISFSYCAQGQVGISNHLNVSPSNTVCGSGTLTFITHLYGGNVEHYTWIKNGINVATSPAVTDTYTCLVNVGDMITTSVDGIDTLGFHFYNASSNTIKIQSALISPSISITGTASTLPGSTVTVNATIANAGGAYNLAWMNNGILFATTTVPTVTYVKGAGIDTITAKVMPTGGGCYDSTTSAQHLVGYFATGVTVADGMAAHVNVYPNPAHDIITISTGGQSIDEIVISNLLGQRLMAATSGNGVTTMQVPLNGLAAGVYLVQVRCGDEVSVKRVVVQ